MILFIIGVFEGKTGVSHFSTPAELSDSNVCRMTVDFGGSDAFMSDESLAEAPAKILHIPTCLGAVVLTYNLPGTPQLKFTPSLVADIFLGKITKWNDKSIMAVNPQEKLPDMNIAVVHRSDGSGTPFVFTDYLSKISEAWEKSVGRGKSVNWPVGLGRSRYGGCRNRGNGK